MKRSRRRWLWALGAALAAASLASGVLAILAERRLSTLVLGGLGVSFSTRLWSAPFPVRDGAQGEAERLVERLDRLGYHRSSGVLAKGEYRWSPPELTVFLRGHRVPGSEQREGVYTLRRSAVGAWSVFDGLGG